MESTISFTSINEERDFYELSLEAANKEIQRLQEENEHLRGRIDFLMTQVP